MYDNKHILRISLPIFLSLLAQNIIQVIDTAFLGRVGEVELGASALAGIFYIAVYTLGFGFSMGSQILIGRRNGEKNYAKIGNIVTQGIMFLMIPAAFLIPFINVFLQNRLPALFESREVAHAVMEYLNWRIYGIVFAFINVMFRAFYIGIARTKVLTWNAIVMALTNVILDYGLIFGNLGLPKMGIGGAALASVISEIVSTLFFVIFTLKSVDLQKYGFRRVNFQWSVIKKILDISVFMMIQYLFSIIIWMSFFIFIENYLGKGPLAISNIVRSFYMILTIPSNALASSTNTLVSNTIGANRSQDVLSLIKRLSIISLVVIIPVILIAACFPRLLINIYTNDLSLIAATVSPFYVLLFALPIYALACISFNAVSGTGNTRIALFFEIITLAFYLSYVYYIIVYRHSSVAMAWTSESIYWLFLFIFSLIYMRSGKWKNKKI